MVTDKSRKRLEEEEGHWGGIGGEKRQKQKNLKKRITALEKRVEKEVKKKRLEGGEEKKQKQRDMGSHKKRDKDTQKRSNNNHKKINYQRLILNTLQSHARGQHVGLLIGYIQSYINCYGLWQRIIRNKKST